MRLRKLIMGGLIAIVAALLVTTSLPLVPYYARPNETYFNLKWENSSEIPVVYALTEDAFFFRTTEGEKGRMHANYWDMAAEIPLFYTKDSPDRSWGVFKCLDKQDHYHTVNMFTGRTFPGKYTDVDEAKLVAHLEFHFLVYVGYGGRVGVTIEKMVPIEKLPPLDNYIPPGKQYEA